VLGIEPVLNEEARRDSDPEHVGHEGELTAARRLIDSLHDTYGGFIDAFVLDALYANGPVMTQLTDYGYGGFLVLKKEKNEPLKDALTLWEIEGRCESYEDPERKEHVEFWDVDDIETLTSYKGKIRAIRAVVTKPGEDPSTWCFAIIGQRARQLARRTALRIIRARWHIENTAFHQWVRYWNLGHVFRHTQNALKCRACFSGRSPLICFRCSCTGGWVVPADPRIRPTPSGTSSRSCFATWPPSASLFLGQLFCSTPADAAPDPR
jgi:hypothetical protein